jgi:hypothetical protein
MSDNKWTMPEPVFRSSTGELVRPGEAEPIDPEPDTLQPEAPDEEEVVLELPDDPLAKLYAPPAGMAEPKPSAPAAAHVPPVEIEPQPFISEEFTAEIDIAEVRPADPKRSSGSVVAALVFFALAAIVVGFIAIVYYLFFTGRSDAGGF